MTASLKSLIKSHPYPSLLATHISILASTPDRSRDETLRQARKYTKRTPTSSRVWLARLRAERDFGDVQNASEEARTNVQGDGIIDVWLWGVDDILDTDGDVHGVLAEQKAKFEVSFQPLFVITECSLIGVCHLAFF